VSLKGRVALVTGSGRGIGRAVAETLAADGATVVVNDRDADVCEATAAEIVRDGGAAVARPLDLDDLDAAAALPGELAASLGGLDILVANAGVMGRGKLVVKTEHTELVELLHTNALAPFALCRAAVPVMREQGGGSIVAVSSVAARRFAPRAASYSMSKAALEAFVLVLAKEERDNGIRVNVVEPGVIDTRLARELVQRSFGADDLSQFDGKTALGRFGAPQDIAEVVRFLVSDAGRHVVGQVIAVDGGA
jgi:NAD(P)-dependent dehydrogenase (short-subunit alcohol dehydrogenase family)